MAEPIELTLMRHARSCADDENVHEGRYDSPLTDAGRKQVSKRAEYFIAEGYKPEKIIASSLIRARETAEIVAQALGVGFETDPDWMEFNNGPLAGLLYAEASARYPQPDFRNPYEPSDRWTRRQPERRLARGFGHSLSRQPGRGMVRIWRYGFCPAVILSRAAQVGYKGTDSRIITI